MRVILVPGAHPRCAADRALDQVLSGDVRQQMYESLRGLLRSYQETLDFDPQVLVEQFELTDAARKVVVVGQKLMQASSDDTFLVAETGL